MLKKKQHKPNPNPAANVYQLLIFAEKKNVDSLLCVSTVWFCAFRALKRRKRQWWVWRVHKTKNLLDLEKKIRADSVCPWQSELKKKQTNNKTKEKR